MAVHRCQITLETTSGVPANRIVNTLYMDDDEIGVPMLEQIAVDVVAFYDLLRGRYSSYITQGNHLLEFYRLSDPEPRVPRYSESWAFNTAPAGNTLPLEVACVLSFQGLPSSGINQARRRGRIYIGPLGSGQTGSDGRLTDVCYEGIADAGQALLDSSIATGWTWVVWSPTEGGAVPVNNGWVDNEPDTQRRRGREASVRYLWEATPE